MDINAASLANREIALNKTNVGFDILNKTLEKTTETKDLPPNAQVKQVQEEQPESGNRIDTFA